MIFLDTYLFYAFVCLCVIYFCFLLLLIQHMLCSILCVPSLFYLRLTVLFFIFFFFIQTPTTEIYTYSHTLSLHDALPIPIAAARRQPPARSRAPPDRHPERIRAWHGTAQPWSRHRRATARSRRRLPRRSLRQRRPSPGTPAPATPARSASRTAPATRARHDRRPAAAACGGRRSCPGSRSPSRRWPGPARPLRARRRRTRAHRTTGKATGR